MERDEAQLMHVASVPRNYYKCVLQAIVTYRCVPYLLVLPYVSPAILSFSYAHRHNNPTPTTTPQSSVGYSIRQEKKKEKEKKS